MHRYQELIAERVGMGLENWEHIRYDVDAWAAYTIDSLHFIDKIKPSGRAIDIGCGYGTMPAYLADKGWKDVVGVDIDPLPNPLFMDKYGVEFIQADIERDTIHIPEFTFDLVVFTEVLEHLGHNPIEAMHKVKWLTSIGGTLILSTPNIENSHWENGGRLQRNQDSIDDYKDIHGDSVGNIDTHHYYYRKGEIKRLLTGLGFNITHLKEVQRHLYVVAERMYDS